MGYLPGPRESDADFTRRINGLRLTVLKSQCDLEKQASKRLWDLYRFWPKGFCWRFQNEGFWPWELGYQETESDGMSLIALRAQCGDSRWHYQKEEVLAHEMAHAARSAYRHNFFDEFLCFKTSKKNYRRNFGPYFANSLTLMVTGAAIMSSLATLICLFCENKELMETMIWRFWFSVQLTQALLICRYFIILGLFYLAEWRLNKNFGKDGLWWLFRLEQSEALRVAIFGKNYLFKRFKKSAFAHSRDRLFAHKLRIFLRGERIKGASNRFEGSPEESDWEA